MSAQITLEERYAIPVLKKRVCSRHVCAARSTTSACSRTTVMTWSRSGRRSRRDSDGTATTWSCRSWYRCGCSTGMCGWIGSKQCCAHFPHLSDDASQSTSWRGAVSSPFVSVRSSARSATWSERCRLNRTGNRRLNSAIRMIALTQARMYPPAIAFMEKKRAEGMSHREARRCLLRRISPAVFKTMETPRRWADSSEHGAVYTS